MVTRRICDRDKTNPGAPVELSVGDQRWDLDLCPEHQEELFAALSPYIEASGEAQRAARAPRRRVRPPRTVPQLVREWAAVNGIEVAPVGPISKQVEDWYLAAQK
jgi:anti-sigma factor RsiW